MIKNVGFIGLGVMGYNIALHIINANKNVHIINRNSENTLKFIKNLKTLDDFLHMINTMTYQINVIL